MKIGLKTFEECIEKISYRNKVRHTDYLAEGKFPVVSQESSLINGYWNQESDVFNVKKPVIVFGDHTRVLKYIDFSFVLGADGIKIIKPKDFIDSKFFYYFLQANPINSKGYARHYKFFKKLNLFVPPLQIQQKIVAKLDKIFSEIDKASAEDEANIKNVKILFKSFLKKGFEYDVETRQYKNLIDVCEINLGKTPNRSNKKLWDINKVKNNKWVSIADLTKVKGKYLLDTKEYISDEGAKLFNYVEPNTILMSFKLSIGKLAFTKEKVYTNEAIVALPIKNNKELNQDFLYYYLKFYDWEKESENEVKVKGKTLNKKKLKKIKILLPPLQIQQKILLKFDKISVQVNKLSELYKNKVNELIFLKQAILQQAFNGELIKAA